jgi:heterodisulfide reductase subunit B
MNNGSSWQVGAPTLITASTPYSTGISNPYNCTISVTNSSSNPERVKMVCAVAGATAINYPEKLQCCTGCSGPYNLTWWANDTMSCALSRFLSSHLALR